MLSGNEGLLRESRWSGRVFNGAWVEASGGSIPVAEPATGETLTQLMARAQT